MRVEKCNNPIHLTGLYFVKTKPIFNPNTTYIDLANVKLSKTGIKYKEDTQIPEDLKEKFSKIPFIKMLTEKFDTFLQYVSTKNPIDKKSNINVAYISWADRTKALASEKVILGRGQTEYEAQSELFKNLETIIK